MSYRREDYCPTTGEPCQSMCETPCGSHQRTVDELAMLVRKLVHQLRKAAPGNDSADKALDYLKRKGLAGTFLRGNSAPHSRDCQRPECMSHGCFGHCMKDST